MIYLYESIETKAGASVVHYEIEQGMQDLPLTRHPQTGAAIRRVILGGWGTFTADAGGGGDRTGVECDCGPDGCC
jgi:predicted nucleic acid-binding Zn ribbon protein